MADAGAGGRAGASLLPAGPFGLLIERAGLALFVLEEGLLVDMNGAAEALMGAPLALCRGRPAGLPMPEGAVVGAGPIVAPGAAELAAPLPVDGMLRRPDGRSVRVLGHVLATPAPPSDRPGRGALYNPATSRTEVAPPVPARPHRVLFALALADERVLAHPGSARVQASLQHVIDTAPLAIAVFDRGARVLRQANRAAELFFGRSCRALVAAGPVAWTDVGDTDFRLALQACLDLAAESPPGVRRDFVRPPGEDGVARVWDTRVVAIASDGDDAHGDADAGHLLMVANEVTDLRAAEQERFDAAIAQRGMLVQEVHHRIKNNLQGVAGLLQQASSRFPQVAPILTEAVGQLQAIAQVYGLQVGASGPVGLAGLLQAVAQAVQRTFNRDIGIDVGAAALQCWRLPETEAIPVALTLNELLTNAIKHGEEGPIRLGMVEDEAGVRIEIFNVGRLRPGFDVRAVPAGASGLGLVRALLPRRSAELSLVQRGGQVCTAVRLKPPAVRRDA